MTLTPRNRDSITEFQAGHYTGVKQLYEEHYAALFDFASQLILNKEEAHQIVQETYIRLLGMRSRFHSQTDIKAFLYITVRNICLAFIRADKEMEPDCEAAWYDQAKIAAAHFELAGRKEEVLQLIHEQVQTLPAPEQIVFRLLFYDRLSIHEAAEESGITVVMVTQRRISAIRLLRRKLIISNLFSIPLFIYFVAVFCERESA